MFSGGPSVLLRFLGQDNLTPVVRKVNNEVKGFQKTVGGIGSSVPIFGKLTNAMSGLISPTTLAIGAGALLSSQFVEGAKRAAEEEVGIAKLGAALRANVPAWDGNTKAIESTITARERFAFSDDELRDSLASILPATKNVTKAFEVQRAAMDLARLKGISLKDASTALVRVEAGQFRMLKSLGIVLKEGATATEALAAVQKAAAGQAEAYANTLSGKLQTLEIRFQDLQENVGRVAVGPLTTFVERLDLAAQGVAVLTGELDLAKLPLEEQLAILEELKSAYPEYTNRIDEAIAALGKQKAATDRASESQRLYMDHLVRETRGGANEMEGATRALYKPIWKEFDVAAFKAEQAARNLGGDLARGVLDGTDDVDAAVEELWGLIKNPPDPHARLQGLLIGKELRAGLNSSNPYISAEARDIRLKILKQLAAHYFFTGGVNAGRSFVRGAASGTSGTFTGSPRRRQHGGPVRRNEAYIVGEKEAEVFVPKSDGVVLPSLEHLPEMSKSRGGGGHSAPAAATVVNVYVNVSGVMTPAVARQIGDELGPILTDYQYRRGIVTRAA